MKGESLAFHLPLLSPRNFTINRRHPLRAKLHSARHLAPFTLVERPGIARHHIHASQASPATIALQRNEKRLLDGGFAAIRRHQPAIRCCALLLEFIQTIKRWLAVLVACSGVRSWGGHSTRNEVAFLAGMGCSCGIALPGEAGAASEKGIMPHASPWYSISRQLGVPACPQRRGSPGAIDHGPAIHQWLVTVPG